MPQLTVYRNKRTSSKAPYLLDVQSGLLSEFRTRVVIPLYPQKSLRGQPISRLTPEVEIEGERYVAMTPQLAGVSVQDLGDAVTRLDAKRDEIIAALDLLITGF